MPEFDREKQSDFMIEQIKDRPINKKKLLRRMLTTIIMALIFGLVASLTFLLLQPILSKWINPEEKPQIVVFPEDPEEMNPEEMLADFIFSEEEELIEEGLTDISQVEQALAGMFRSRSNFEQAYSTMAGFVSDLKRSMVTITGISDGRDWMDNLKEDVNRTNGVVVANNGIELLVLADYEPLKGADRYILSFFDDTRLEVHLQQRDMATGLAVFTIRLDSSLQEYVEKDVRIAEIGSSNSRNIVGVPVVALGSPMGNADSIGYGMIVSAEDSVSLVDMNCKILQTDIPGSRKAGGMIFDLKGRLLGIIRDNGRKDDLKNLIAAYGISDLKERVQLMSNNSSIAYMGIVGSNVPISEHEDHGMPYGAYVQEVIMNSPAMMAGIHQGDVITEVDGRSIQTFADYADMLMSHSVGEHIGITLMRRVQDDFTPINFMLDVQSNPLSQE